MKDEGLELLTSFLFNKTWFCQVELDTSNRYIVYVKHMNAETMATIPDTMLDRQVLVHYIAYKNAKHESFTTNGNRVPFVKTSEPLLVDNIEEFYADNLIKELTYMEVICGKETLQAAFYEIHDGKNAITNVLADLPDIKKRLQTLYDDYGFDLLYEQLEK